MRSESSEPPVRSAASCASLLAERQLPGRHAALFASARSAGRTLPWGDAEITVEDADHGRLRRPRHRALLRRAAPPPRSSPRRSPRPAPSSSTTPRPGAWTPTCPSSCPRSTPMPWPTRPQGDRRQPQLHHHGRHAACSSRSTDEAGLRRVVVSTYQAVSGAGLAGVDELDEQVRKVVERAAELDLRRSRACEFPEPENFVDTDRLQRGAARRVDSSTTARRDRRGAEAARREPQDPRPARPRRCRAPASGCPVFTGHSLSINAAFDRGHHRPSGPTELLADAPGVRARRRADAARRGRHRPHLRRPDPASTRRSSHGLACSSRRQPPQGRGPQRGADRRSPRGPWRPRLNTDALPAARLT